MKVSVSAQGVLRRGWAGWRAGAAAAFALVAAACSSAPETVAAPASPTEGGDVEWAFYAGDPGSRKYSPLEQIHAGNIDQLQIAWVWKSPDGPAIRAAADAGRPMAVDAFKGTPLMVDGKLFIRTQLGTVEALDPADGRTVWRREWPQGRSAAPKSYGYTTRGLAYWKNAQGEGRLFSTTPDRKLLAIDARTGELAQEFGAGGVLDLDAGLRRIGNDPSYMNYGNQTPVVIGDVIVLGSVVTDAEFAYLTPDRKERPVIPVGDVRGFNARTGELLWTFHTVPQQGEFGVETWENESWRWVGSTNVWSLMSADPDLGYVYLPVTGPTFNYYGGFRKGDNLYGDSIVCLDAKTGRRVWHFQAVHHPVFDYDMPAAPVLADIVVDGKPIKAVVAMPKSGFLFVLDRVTGKPVWPIEERPVPQSTMPGERTSPTQPFPTRPPPVTPQGMGPDKVNRLTPALEAATAKILDSYDHGSIYTPLTERGTILSPGIGGGPNWPGAAFDPETGRLYVTTINQPTIRSLQSSDNYYGYVFRQISEPLGGHNFAAPPWATIVSVDLNKGDIDWTIANGPGPKEHPDLKHLQLPDLGTPAKSNAMATRTLLFAATTGRQDYSPQPAATDMRIGAGVDPELLPELRLDNRAMLRAYDKASGKLVWKHPIGPSFNDGGAPMTYMWKGRQYVVTPSGGGPDQGSYLIAFALPEGSPVP